MFFFEYSGIFKNACIEEHLRTAASVSIWHILLKGSSNKSEFYTCKPYYFSIQQVVKKINPPKYSSSECCWNICG